MSLEGKASFYPNLCSIVNVRVLESDQIVNASNDHMAHNFELRHFIHKAYLESIHGGNEILESMVEASPPCSILCGTKKADGERVLGMLSKRLHVACYGRSSKTWYKLKLQNVLVVEDMPVPLHISLKYLQRNQEDGGNGALVFDLADFSGGDEVRLIAQNFPPQYRSHPYWAKTNHIFIGMQDEHMQQQILDSATGMPTAAYMDRVCAHCGKGQPPQRCARCKQAAYCNQDCQVSHWKVHKKQCKKKSRT